MSFHQKSWLVVAKVTMVQVILLGSISSTFFEQLLNLQIPKAEKTVKLSVFFALSGSAHVKAAHRMLVKLTPDHSGNGR